MIPTLVLRPPYPSAWVRAACVVSCARRKARLACQHIASLVTAPLLQVLILSRKLEDGHLSSSTTHRVGGGERDRARPASTCRPASMDESSLLGCPSAGPRKALAMSYFHVVAAWPSCRPRRAPGTASHLVETPVLTSPQTGRWAGRVPPAAHAADGGYRGLERQVVRPGKSVHGSRPR